MRGSGREFNKFDHVLLQEQRRYFFQEHPVDCISLPVVSQRFQYTVETFWFQPNQTLYKNNARKLLCMYEAIQGKQILIRGFPYSGAFLTAGLSLQRGFPYSGAFLTAGLSLQRGFPYSGAFLTAGLSLQRGFPGID